MNGGSAMALQFDDIVRLEAPRPELARDWHRQRSTARELCTRLANGYDTQLLADEVGMGKTYVAMAVMASTLLGRGGRALLVTPSSSVLRSKWEQEIRSFSDTYLLPARRRRSLRPLVVRDYWDLLSNLHDHANAPLDRVHEATLRCVLLSLRTFAVRKQWITNRHSPWTAVEGLQWTDPLAMRFKSDYSVPAWEAFLEMKNAQENGEIERLVKILTREPQAAYHALARIKGFFRDFTRVQDEFEPNVLILGMGSLGRRPRADSVARQQFASYVLACLLRGRWQDTRKAVLKAVRGIVGPLKLRDLDEMARTNLYRSGACVDAVLQQNPDLCAQWESIRMTPKQVDERTVQQFFATFLDRVVTEKLKESGICLAVVDEAHNWKSGANGADRFREIIAPAVASKLLMSATPFQLEEGEMRRVLGYAMSPKGKSARVLAAMFDGGAASLVASCLASSRRFEEALIKLSPDDATCLATLCAAQSSGVGERVARAANDALLAADVVRLCKLALEYRECIDDLLAEQRKLIVRHLKDRSHRHFHAGADFGKSMMPPRHALYRARGLWDDRHEFINYLAMRIDQRVRSLIRGQQGKDTSAHLMRGLSSSRAAFRASNAEVHKQIDRSTQSLKDALGRFQHMVDHFDHPKVSTTVGRAFANYLQGRKTLVFCERVPTVHEISEAVRQRIEAHWGVDTDERAGLRRSILHDSLFTDLPIYRSWLRLQGQPVRVDRDSEAARQYVLNALISAQTLPTERRVLRLLDLWSLEEHVRLSRIVPSPALKMLVVLAQCVRAGAHGPLLLDVRGTRENHVPDAKEICRMHDKVVAAWGQRNLWIEETTDVSATAFDQALWRLLEDEASRLTPANGELEAATPEAFYGVIAELQVGLRKVALRTDLLRRYLREGERAARNDAVYEGLRSSGAAESAWSRIVRFLQALARANGTINPRDRTNTQRRSLWRGVNLKTGEDEEDRVVATLTGSVDPETRVTICAAFNSPLAPDILVCTAIGSEGIDLHRECAEVIHHDLPWNPARLEQRIGRIDRVNSLAEVTKNGCVRIGIPFLANDYEQFQYEKVLSRAQLFEVLLGRPDFEPITDEEKYQDDGVTVEEVVADLGAVVTGAAPLLPDSLATWLRPDLSLEAAMVSRTN